MKCPEKSSTSQMEKLDMHITYHAQQLQWADCMVVRDRFGPTGLAIIGSTKYTYIP